MNKESKNIKNYKCLLCNKVYTSQSSFCNHKKLYHKTILHNQSANQSNNRSAN